MHEDNAFITLTYRQEEIPDGHTLRVRDFQLFIKRLRKRLPGPLSYFHCGEYGERFGRPHYHAAVFGEGFLEDRIELPKTAKGYAQWTSPLLSEVWGLGRVAVMDLTFDSAQYLAKYITVKVTGDKAEAHYAGKLPEYATMSKKPAIGRRWFDKYARDVYPRDEVVIGGTKGKPPKYYDELLKVRDPSGWEKMKKERIGRAEKRGIEDQTKARRSTRAELAEIRAARFSREIDWE